MKTKDYSGISRLVVLAIALANQALVVSGQNPLPFSEEAIYEAGSLLFTVGMSVYAGWKNNSVTPEAKQADEVLRELKEVKKRKHDSDNGGE